MENFSNKFSFGQIVRIDYGLAEYWIEVMVIRRTEKKYDTVMHRKSHPCIECPDKWKVDSLESYGRVIDDLSATNKRVTS